MDNGTDDVTAILEGAEAALLLKLNGSGGLALGVGLRHFIIASLESGIDPLTVHEHCLQVILEFYEPKIG